VEKTLIDHELLRKALDVATTKGADYADVFVERGAYQTVIADDKKLRTGFSVERGIGIRAVQGGRTFYAITNSFAEPDVLKVAAYVGDAVGGHARAGSIADLSVIGPAAKRPFEIPPTEAETDQKADLVKRAEERTWGVPFAVQATIEYRDQQRDIVLASTLNHRIVSQTLGLTEFSASIILERNGVRQSGSRGYSFYAGMEALTGDYAPERIAERAAEIAAMLFTAKDCPRGEMPVVFAPGSNGILFHESCGHGMEADLVEKGSTFTGKVGQLVASPLVTLIDDGTLPGYPGSFAFDDEGTPSEKTVLIENGILRGYMHSSITAHNFNVAPTGSARRESYEFPPIPRMRNTYICAGEAHPGDIIKSTKRGLYALRPGGGGQVNVTTGEFITSIKLGYMIEDGRITYPVRGASIIGRGIDALRDIDMVGNDLVIEKSSGRCGKGQQVAVGVGMPTVRVKALTVGGTGEAYDGGGQ
jgi:TldD protein